MFCPDGYDFLTNIQNRLSSETLEQFEEHWHASQADSLSDMLEDYLFATIARNVCICSPDGTVLRFSLNNMLAMPDVDFVPLNEALAIASKSKNVGSLPAHFAHSYGLSLAGDVIVEDAGHMRLPFWYERQSGTITLEGYDFLEKCNYDGLHHFHRLAQTIRPFEGWALCVPEAFIENELNSRFRELLQKTVHDDPIIRRSGGRPAVTRMKTREAYVRLFPDGHNDTPWLEVLRKVNRETGLNASLDTLKRAASDVCTQQNPD